MHQKVDFYVCEPPESKMNKNYTETPLNFGLLKFWWLGLIHSILLVP